jgi:hypothetical protein
MTGIRALTLANEGWWVQTAFTSSGFEPMTVLIGEGSGTTTMTRERALAKAAEVAAEKRTARPGTEWTVRAVRVDRQLDVVEATEGVRIVVPDGPKACRTMIGVPGWARQCDGTAPAGASRRSPNPRPTKGPPPTMSNDTHETAPAPTDAKPLAFGDDFEVTSLVRGFDEDGADGELEEADSKMQVLGGGPSEYGTYDYVTFSIYGDNEVQIPHERMPAFLAKLAAVSGIQITFPV